MMTARTNQNQYSAECPFCTTAVASYAPVCAGCGASKSHRGDTLKPGVALMRAGLWANTLGLILFLTGYMVLQPWFDKSILQGTQKVCRTEVVVKKPAAFEFLRNEKREIFQIARDACEDLPDLERRKAGLLAAAIKAEPKTATIALGKTFTTRETKPGPSTWQNWFEVIIRSVIALLAGALVFGLARNIWTKVLGRLNDPIWIRC